MGRPKGSKNKPKVNVPVVEIKVPKKLPKPAKITNLPKVDEPQLVPKKRE